MAGFAQKFSKINNKNFSLTTDLLNKLKDREWKGNVRELENTIQRMVVLQSDEDISSDIDITDKKDINNLEDSLDKMLNDLLLNYNENVYDEALKIIEKPLLDIILQKVDGNQLKAAKLLGINRNTLHKKLLQYNLIK